MIENSVGKHAFSTTASSKTCNTKSIQKNHSKNGKPFDEEETCWKQNSLKVSTFQ
jgi:hypothetical protein